ncbi:HotDog domain containing protein, partial [Amanita muscaria]
EADIAHISGNVPDSVKRALGRPSVLMLGHYLTDTQFGASICKRLVSKEIAILDKAEEPLKKECRFVCELTVEEDMLNIGGTLHGGCAAYLIEACSTVALVAFGLAQNEPQVVGTVLQSLNIVYHSPAAVGDKLRIVNRTMTIGSRAVSARAEIWNDTHHRLVASGTNVSMQPSP